MSSNKKYKATFTAQAEVTFVIEVEGAHQEEGLSSAYDSADQVALETVKVLRIIPGTIFNLELQCVQQPVVIAPVVEAVAPAQGHTVQAYSDRGSKGELMFSIPVQELVKAKSTMQSLVQGEFCAVGSACVLDAAQLRVANADASRGGWEVEVEVATTGFASTPVPRELHSWIPSKSEALKTATTLLGRSAGSVIRILDYTDRASGPKLWRKIG